MYRQSITQSDNRYTERERSGFVAHAARWCG